MSPSGVNKLYLLLFNVTVSLSEQRSTEHRVHRVHISDCTVVLYKNLMFSFVYISNRLLFSQRLNGSTKDSRTIICSSNLRSQTKSILSRNGKVSFFVYFLHFQKVVPESFQKAKKVKKKFQKVVK